MLRLIKYLKPFGLAILLIVGLLFVQAQLDLALPDRMSDMVNIGIAQQGVTETVPEALTPTTLGRLQQVLSPTEADVITQAYVQDGDRLRLNEATSELEATFIKGFEILAGYGLSGRMDLTPEEAWAQVTSLPESARAAIPTQMVLSEYKLLGVDMAARQNRFILSQGGTMLLIALLSMLSTLVVAYISSRVAAGLGRNLRELVFHRVMAMSGHDFEDISVSSLITRSTNDITQIQNLIVMLFRMMVYAPVLAVGAVLKIMRLNSSMTWIVAIAIGVIIVILLVVFSYAVPRFKLIQKLTDRLNLVTRQTLTGLLVVRAFNNEAEEASKFSDVSAQMKQAMLKVSRIMITTMPLMMLVMNGVALAIIWFGASQIDQGQLQVGDLMAFIQYAIQIISAFLMFSMVSFIYPRASVSAKRVSEIIEQPANLNDGTQALDTTTPSIEFNNVSFSYEATEEPVLKDISFTIPYGSTVGILGGTGSGKSTLIKLLLRFYDPTKGTIRLGTRPMTDLLLSELRGAISYAPQASSLFSGTIGSNLSLGSDWSEDRIWQVSETAQAKDFIEKDPEGLEKVVAQAGTNFSGGQKQRLQIARALYKDAPILLFDDSFSALDFTTDALLRQAIRQEYPDKTKIIVAQRINSVRDADHILVLDEGCLVCQGTHQDLEATCRVYQEILQSQLPQEVFGD